MSHAKVASRILLSTSQLLAASVLLSVLAICQSAPLRMQRDVVTNIAVVTLPPTGSTTPNCKQVSNEYLALSRANETNLYAELVKTYQDHKNLSFEDVKDVYAPSCKLGNHERNEFKEVQCLIIPEHSWPTNLTKYFCWCADPITGHPINGITEGLITQCGPPPQPCQFDGEEIPHEDQREVKDDNQCHICKCFNGTMNCRKAPSRENFTSDRLYHLKVQLLKRFYIQMYRNKDTKDDISKAVEEVFDQRAIDAVKYTVQWKWDSMDKNLRNYLTVRALIKYVARDVVKVTCSFHLLSNFGAILNANNDDGVDETEFKDFFNLTKNDVHLQRIKSLILPEIYGTSGVDPTD